MRAGLGLRIIGSRHSSDATRLREFAARNRLPHVWIELEEDPEAEALLERFGVKPSETPVAVWQGEDVLKNPTNAELARTIGLEVDAPVEANLRPRRGRGRACGSRRRGLRSFGGPLHPRPGVDRLGGQAGTSSRIENFLGFPAGLSGFELASRVLVQADKFGARIAVPQEAVSLRRENGHYRIELSEGGEVAARSVIAATGGPLPQAGGARPGAFRGVSVHYAATEAEAQRCEGEEVVVVGGGNSAGQAADFLAGRARQVYLLIRGEDLLTVVDHANSSPLRW